MSFCNFPVALIQPARMFSPFCQPQTPFLWRRQTKMCFYLVQWSIVGDMIGVGLTCLSPESQQETTKLILIYFVVFWCDSWSTFSSRMFNRECWRASPTHTSESKMAASLKLLNLLFYERLCLIKSVSQTVPSDLSSVRNAVSRIVNPLVL